MLELGENPKQEHVLNAQESLRLSQLDSMRNLGDGATAGRPSQRLGQQQKVTF